jgi:hypothetical protein
MFEQGTRFSCEVLMKVAFSRLIIHSIWYLSSPSKKDNYWGGGGSNTKFQEYPSSRISRYISLDRHENAYSRFSQICELAQKLGKQGVAVPFHEVPILNESSEGDRCCRPGRHPPQTGLVFGPPLEVNRQNRHESVLSKITLISPVNNDVVR